MEKKKEKKQNIFVKIFTIIMLIGFALLLYSHFIGTKGLLIREYAVINNKIPENFNGFKIVHFTDLHYGTTINKKEMNNLVNKINELKPDIVVFTGDLLDKHVLLNDKQIDDLVNGLNSIEANIDKYIISGNHDINKGYENVLERIDFKNLDNKNELVYYKGNTPIAFIGLADYLEFGIKPEDAFNYEKNEEDGYYNILLTHEPDVVDNLKDYSFNLVLSGHSHNGQVRLPFIGKIYTPIGCKMYYDEKYELANAIMYISGGLGTSAAPFRFLVKPSFNLYRLYSN